jgi:hypothetical protein
LHGRGDDWKVLRVDDRRREDDEIYEVGCWVYFGVREIEGGRRTCVVRLNKLGFKVYVW